MERAQTLGCRSSILAGLPGSQVMDIMATCQFFQELNCDDGSRWSLATADIQQCYDSICPAALARSLIGHGISPAVAMFAARLHVAPIILLCHAHMEVPIHRCIRGLLTGSKSASVLAMLPVLDVADCSQLILKDCIPLGPVAFLGLAEPFLSDEDVDCSWRHWLLPSTSERRSFA
jgi:hypothetical protein